MGNAKNNYRRKRDSEKRFQTMVETINEWVWEVDQNGRYTYSSSKVFDLLGYDPEEVIGKTPFDFMPADEAKRAVKEFEKIAAEKKPFFGLKSIKKHKDGRLLVLEKTGSPILNKKGQLAGYVGTDRDVTSKIALEKEAQEKVRYLNNVGAFIAVTELSGEIIFVNEAPLKPLGLTANDVKGIRFPEVEWWTYDPQLKQSIEDAIKAAARGESVVVENTPNLSGNHLPMKYTCDPLRDENGKIYAIIHTGTPIVEQHKAMEELQEKLRIINTQQEAIRELSTPILEIWDNVLALPVIGVVDTQRSTEIMENLLRKIITKQSKCVIIDVTGVEIVEAKTADYLLKVCKAAQLLGAYCVLTGINPAVAETLVEIGADLSTVKTFRNLKVGLIECIKYIRGARANKSGD